MSSVQKKTCPTPQSRVSAAGINACDPVDGRWKASPLIVKKILHHMYSSFRTIGDRYVIGLTIFPGITIMIDKNDSYRISVGLYDPINIIDIFEKLPKSKASAFQILYLIREILSEFPLLSTSASYDHVRGAAIISAVGATRSSRSTEKILDVLRIYRSQALTPYTASVEPRSLAPSGRLVQQKKYRTRGCRSGCSRAYLTLSGRNGALALRARPQAGKRQAGTSRAVDTSIMFFFLIIDDEREKNKQV
jgi:hypothetical protein